MLIFKKIAIFLILIIIIDFFYGLILKNIYLVQGPSRFAKTTYILDKANEDIIIVGNSRAEHHYVPEVFEDSLGIKCFNAGSDGQSIFYFHAIINGFLERNNSQKLIILELGPNSFNIDKVSYDRLSYLYPYYKNHKEIRKIVNLKSPYEQFKIYSNLFTYNSMHFIIAKSFIKPNTYQNGYGPIYGCLDIEYNYSDNLNDQVINNLLIDNKKVQTFKEILKKVNIKNSNLIVIQSPCFGFRQQSKSIEIIKSLTDELSIPFFNYINEPDIHCDNKLFHDTEHLNNDGAIVFSKLIINDINKVVDVYNIKRKAPNLRLP